MTGGEVVAFRKDRDYPMLAGWYASWGAPEIPEDELPETGFLYVEEGSPVITGFLVLTNTKSAVMEFVCADPKSDWQTRERGILALTEVMSTVAKSFGFSRLVAYLTGKRLVDKGVAAGWSILGENYIGCVKQLRGN